MRFSFLIPSDFCHLLLLYHSSTIIKCIFDPLNLFTVNRYYIKPTRRFSIAISQQKELCSLADTLLFAIIYCCRCISAFFIASILHFYKYQIFSVSNDQVNFSAFAAKILCYNKKALFFQKGSRLFFMAAAYFTFINAQICSLISYLCVGILCNLSKCV